MKKKNMIDSPYGVETRAYECSIETREAPDDSKHTIVGHPIVYNSKTAIGDMWYETIAQGALDDCDLKDVMLLMNHDRTAFPLARSRNNTSNSTMRLSIENDGLHIEADVDDKNPRGAELLSAVTRGDITGMSFGFVVAEDEWSDLEAQMPTRTIKKISKVVEVSAVTNPAYEATKISSRSLDNAREALESEKHAMDIAKEEARMRSEILKSLLEV